MHEDGLGVEDAVFQGAKNAVHTVTVVAHPAAKVAQAGLSAARIGSIAVKTADIVTDFMPLVSGGKDIYNGIRNGNGWQVALGVGSIALDVFTFGSSSITKGFIKTGIRQGAEMIAKKEAITFASNGMKAQLLKFGCFVKGTPVWTADGEKAIEKIKPGEYVYAYDTNKKKVVKKKVTKAYVRKVDRLIKIEYQGEVIYTTTEHPFYINNNWVKAGELKAGDSLFLENGKTKIPVQKITVIDTSVTVYNITVADAHDYYVGRSKVLVHNNPCAETLSKAGRTIVESKDATRVLDRLAPAARKNVDKAIDLIREGKAGGNQHVLTGDLKGYKAIDIKGSGKGRGALRMVYKETDNEILIHSIQDYH